MNARSTALHISLAGLLLLLTWGCLTSSDNRLSTGRSIDPQSSTAQNLGSLPVHMIVSADGRYAITTNAGFRQSLSAVRIGDGTLASRLEYPNKKGKTATTQEKSHGLYYGLAAGPGVVYAAQGGRDAIAVLSLDAAGQLKQHRTIETRPGDFPAGLALDGQGRLYVTNNYTPVALPDFIPASVAVYDAASGQELGRFAFADSYGGSPNFPLALAVTRDGKKLYVASERDDAVYVLDTSNPAQIRQITKISTGSHPLALLMDRAQKKLIVANAHSDTVSFIDIASDQVTGTVLLRPDIARSIAGATPTGLALSPDEKRLYVTLADMNAVAVIDVPDVELEGYIPVGWYPTSVTVTPDSQRLLVTNAKGTQVHYPNPRPGTTRQVSPLSLLEGNLISVTLPTKEELRSQTQRVLELNRLTPRHITLDNPLAHIGLKAGKIKHVIYIVKENRTYDHVLGDDPRGNGDPRYCLFGREVTPNQHALAQRFNLMDNFYDSGEVSGDGWSWSTQAMANEYTSRNVPYQYSDRGRRFDYEGTNNHYPTGGFPANGPDGKPLSEDPKFKDGAPPIPDVAQAPGGHLWDLALRHGLTLRNYGFFVSDGLVREGKQITPDNYPASRGLQPAGRDLGGITDIDFRRFDMNYPDSDAWRIYYEKTKNELYKWPLTEFGHYKAPSRFAEWNREFQMMLQKDPTGGAVPNLMLIRFCTDHTAGANPGKKSPRAMVADNDYAVGQLVEAVSKSPIWKHCAIFIIEDDAQDGPDHVDAHRSTCYVISPYMKRGTIDHTFHNTASCLHTMELLLGLPPLCQYDAIAEPIGHWDSEPRNLEPFTAILPPGKIIGQTNPKQGEVTPISPEARLMKESMEMDFVNADQADANKLNQIIWKLCKGFDAQVPPTPKAFAGVGVPKVKDDDD